MELKNLLTNKKERKEFAKNHILFMQNKYSKEIIYSISHSVIYSNKNIDLLTNIINNKQQNIRLIDSDIISVLEQIEDKNVAILNFASYRNPGGGFLNGAMAQEEAICYESNLYNIISSFKDFYSYNNTHINNNLYLNRAIYSPKVYFNTIDKFFNVITCASPNYKAFSKGHKNTIDNTNALKDRINFIFAIAEKNNIQTLILGAFGCGAFKQDPEEVAKIFLNESKKTNIKNLIFAIPDKTSANYLAFQKVLYKNEKKR